MFNLVYVYIYICIRYIINVSYIKVVRICLEYCFTSSYQCITIYVGNHTLTITSILTSITTPIPTYPHMHIHTCIPTHPYPHPHTHTPIPTPPHPYPYTHTHTCIHTYPYPHTHTHIPTHPYPHTHNHTPPYPHTHNHTPPYPHTHTHTTHPYPHHTTHPHTHLLIRIPILLRIHGWNRAKHFPVE